MMFNTIDILKLLSISLPSPLTNDTFNWSIALRTDPKNRTSHGRPPARLRQTLTVVLKIREEKRPKTE